MTVLIVLRSLAFNLLFFGLTALMCIALVPLLPFSRKPMAFRAAKFFTNGVYLLEKYVIGLDYEIRGKEYLPEHGPYLVAAKHQSAYETMKLHQLFGDPSIILKRELLRIPIWGTFLYKQDIIAIDRANREEAINSIIDGARRMKDQGRPIVIFPQGTRVDISKTAQDKPYKGGISKMYEETGLTIIPMALNSGLFWGRNSFIKRPGIVTFEFLPPVEPGLPEKKVMKALEERIETSSIKLMDEAKDKYPYLRSLKTPKMLAGNEEKE